MNTKQSLAVAVVAIAAAASSGLMVTRTHKLKILRTVQCHARLNPSTGFMVKLV